MHRDRNSTHVSESRRDFLGGVIGCFAYLTSLTASANQTTSGAVSSSALEANFNRILRDLRSDIAALNVARRYREFEFGSLERAPIRAALSHTPISQQATQLIVTCEVSSQSVYTRKYQSPVWPKGASGVTIGIGYDIGYTTADWFSEDWTNYLPNKSLSELSTACGITGTEAGRAVLDLTNVRVPWQAAMRQFEQQTQTRYVGETERALQNTKLLSPDSLGALVSLVYNRGPSFGIPPERDPTNRYMEMRNIGLHMANRKFDKIPGELRSMKRLWINNTNMRGLLKRREAEAILFEIGIKQHSTG